MLVSKRTTNYKWVVVRCEKLESYYTRDPKGRVFLGFPHTTTRIELRGGGFVMRIVFNIVILGSADRHCNG